MRPPICELCDADLDPADESGGLVTFQPDDVSRDWHRRAAQEPGFVGHPPDTGWFCTAHIDAAREAARTFTFSEGMRRLRAEDGPAPDPAPDLVGVDLGSGRLVSSDRFDLHWVEWTMAPIEAHAFAASLRSVLPALFEVLRLGAVPGLEQKAERRWTPMDGALPPWCPFIDTTVDTGQADGGAAIELCVVLAHWNDDEVATASVSLTIGDHAVSAHAANGTGREVDTLRVRRPTSAAVIAVVAALVR